MSTEFEKITFIEVPPEEQMIFNRESIRIDWSNDRHYAFPLRNRTADELVFVLEAIVKQIRVDQAEGKI